MVTTKSLTNISIHSKEKKMNILGKVKRFFKDEEGASAVEYALMVAVIAVALLGGVTTFYNALSDKMTENAEAIGAGGGS
jgi:pilus assembly protein Flp/PilA